MATQADERLKNLAHDKLKKTFSIDQLISATDVTRSFKMIRTKAKDAPLLILDKNSPDSVLLSIEDYTKLIDTIDELMEYIFDIKVIEKIKEIEEKGLKPLTFSEIAKEQPRIIEALKKVEKWDISDAELFE